MGFQYARLLIDVENESSTQTHRLSPLWIENPKIPQKIAKAFRFSTGINRIGVENGKGEGSPRLWITGEGTLWGTRRISGS